MKENGTLIIYTGGTIGMSKEDMRDGFLINQNDIIVKIINLLDLHNNDKVQFTSKIIDSSQLDYLIINEILNIIKNNYSNFKGFLIIGGTDTMAYLQSVLKWHINGLKKPILLTGASKSYDQDANEGINNIKYALNQINLLEHQSVVGICMNNKLYVKPTTKFDSLSKTPYIETEYSYLEKFRIEQHNNKKEVMFYNLKDIKIEIMNLNPFLFISKNMELADGLIILTYGQGTIIENDLLKDRIKAYSDLEKPIILISQCFINELDINQYKASEFLNYINSYIAPGSSIEEGLAFINYKYSYNMLIS
ncbi:MAG: asparaginase domain-containing protein [Firmicutes bacterium]|nr:asparaginase domain-containing protein [Bacillota bacterium]